MGSEGRIAGTLVGALVLGALSSGPTLLNVPSFHEQIVTGRTQPHQARAATATPPAEDANAAVNSRTS